MKGNSYVPFMLRRGDGSTLSLDFTAMGGTLDSRFTFTRSTTATFINSQGYVQFDDHNLVRNSTFTSLTGWASTGSGTTTNAGGVLTLSTSAVQTQLFYAQTNANGFQDNSPMSGRVYSASIQVSGVSGGMSYQEIITVGGTISSGVHYLNGTAVSSSATAENGLITFVWTSGGANTLRIGIGASGSTTYPSASVSISLPRCVIGSQVQPTYIESPVSSTYHGPRFDCDPTTLTPRGLLIEGAATNLTRYSEELDQVSGFSYWYAANFNTPSKSGSPTDPFNGTNAWKLIAASGAGFHGWRQLYTFTAAAYTLSFWAKAAEYDRVLLSDLTSGQGGCTFVLSGSGTATVVAGTVTPTNPTIVPYLNGWYRCSVTMVMPASSIGIALAGFPVGATTGAFGASYTADGTSGVWITGVQTELGTAASSYIPTTTSTVQRTADSCAIALSSFGFNTSAGTLFADWFRKNSDSGSQGGGPWNTDYASGRWLGVQNGIASNTVSLSSWSGSTNISNGATRNKAAATYGAWTGSVVPTTFCVNNSAVTSATRDFNPSTATYLTIGAASSSAGSSPAFGVATRDWLNNSIRSIKYWPSILPDATLQSLTT